MNKDELKRQIKLNSHLEYDKAELRPAFVYVPVVIDLINQLDEPKKPVIPQFVAGWIDVAKSRHFTLFQAMVEYADTDIKEWIWKYYNSDLFGKAWSAYPNIEVEKEQKYEVKDKHGCFILIKNLDGEVINAYSKVVNKKNGQLTEQEIKDYDERYVPFMVPVEEVDNE